MLGVRFGSMRTKIGTIQRSAQPPCEDDTQIREAFHIFLQKLRFYEGFLGDEEGWYLSEYNVILECEEFLWVEFRGSLSGL